MKQEISTKSKNKKCSLSTIFWLFAISCIGFVGWCGHTLPKEHRQVEIQEDSGNNFQIIEKNNACYLVHIPYKKEMINESGEIYDNRETHVKFIELYSSYSDKKFPIIRKVKKNHVKIEEITVKNWQKREFTSNQTNIYLPSKLYKQTVKILEKIQKEKIQEELEKY